MGLTKTINRQSKSGGFTVIEVLIVLAIAALILLVLFLAVPHLQRDVRNNRRLHDAMLFAEAVNECLYNTGNPNNCKTPASIPINPNEFSIFSEYAYHDVADPTSPCYTNPTPGCLVITTDGPVWWFGTQCNGVTGPISVQRRTSFTVHYIYETGEGDYGAHCINGN